jgi:transcriptional regulator with XRE-family HTH domain
VDDILKRLGQRIRGLRIQRGFKSQEEFADYCKMHRTFLGHLETGRKDFRLTTVIRVADALGVTLSELFAGLESGDMPKVGRNRRGGAVDRYGILKEVEAIERTLKRIKAIASPEYRQPAAGSPRGKVRKPK